MAKTNTSQLEVTGAYGILQYAWAQVPEEFVPMRLQGASIFTKFEDGDVDPTDLFGGNIPFVIGSNAQQSGLAGDVMYAAFAMDELGCMSGEGFSFEKPKPAAIAPPAWGLFGNDANGYLTTVSSNSTDLFTAFDANALGQLTRYVLGNGLTTQRAYDNLGRPQDIYTEDVLELMHQFEEGTGNLEWREKTSGPAILTEDFDYDDLNRLTDADVLNSNVQLNIAYEDNGNIEAKSDAGTFDYWPNKPNAVKSITNRVVNDIQDISLATQDIAYTTEGRRVAMISEGKYRATFTYGIDNQRKKMVIEELVDGNLDEYKNYLKRYYMGACEKVQIWDEDTGGVWIDYDLTYISGGDGLCAINVITDGNTSASEYYYVYKDHLGSVLKLTNSDATEEWEQSFDAWGRYRDPDTWEVLNSNPYDEDLSVDMPVWFTRSYTGHEHLPEFDLINMNGRFYDPIPGRMLSADNYVQEPGNSQSYNRYAYVMNNPMKYTDPNGEWLIAAAAALVVAGVSYLIGASRNDWEMNPGKWTNSDGVGIGFTTNSAGTTSLYGFGNAGGVSWTGGAGINGGGFGGGLSTFGQASYNQMPSGGTGSINMSQVDNQRSWDNAHHAYSGLAGNPTIESLGEATWHYYTGNGTPARISPNAFRAVLRSSDFKYRHNRIVTGKTDMTILKGNFGVDMTYSGTYTHLGDTKINYSIDFIEGDYISITYDFFVGDGFWDSDVIDEKVLGGWLREPSFIPDGPGPNLERFGGIPYPFIPEQRIYYVPNPGY